MRNDMLAEVVFEQKESGNQPYGCELGGIDFAQVANACGAAGSRCTQPRLLRSALASTVGAPGPALLEVHVDPAEPITTPEKLKV